MGGSLNGSGDPASGYSMRGGRMLTTDNYECTWDLYKSIPSVKAVEFRRYLHPFMLEFSRIETLAGVKRTIYNQYSSLVVPLQAWPQAQGVNLVTDCRVIDLDHTIADDACDVTGIHCLRQGKIEVIAVKDYDFVFIQNGSMTDAFSLGSMTRPPSQLTKMDSCGWLLWEKLAEGRPEFGNPAAFNFCIAQSCWESFTVTLKNPAFFDKMIQFSGNEPGTGGLVTFKDSNWLMSISTGSRQTGSGRMAKKSRC